MKLKWNDIAAIRGYHHCGLTILEIAQITDYKYEDITEVVEQLKKELAWKEKPTVKN